MGLMDVPAKTWEKRLGLALKIEGAIFSAFWVLAYTVKFGMVWVPNGPPMSPPFFDMSAGAAAWLFNMILAVYFVLGIYMWKAGNNPGANKNLIGFCIWGANFLHGVIAVLTVIYDDSPVYSGPMPIFGDIPERLFGIAHWQNITPVGDVPLLFIIALANAYMAKRAFNSYLLPWDDY